MSAILHEMKKKQTGRLLITYTKIIEKDGYKDIRHKRIRFDPYYARVYDAANPKLDLLGRASQALFRYLITKMDTDNMIFSNSEIRSSFMEYLRNAHKTDLYTDGTIKGAFVELKKHDLLIEKSRGVLYINPLYVWKGDEEDRIKAIEKILVHKYNNLKVTVE